MSDRTAIALVTREQSPAQLANLRPFPTGRSGNALGRPKGSRNKISQAFVDEMCASFEEHGRDTIERVRLQYPVEYLKIAAALIPRSFESQPSNPLEELSDAQHEFLGAVLSALTQAEQRGEREVTLTLPVA